METNNKLREALVEVQGCANGALLAISHENVPIQHMWDIIDVCKAALAAPPRNCDVLETEELIRQHNSFCGNSKNSYKCINASASECRRCLAKFMQMPYVDKKEGAK